MNFRDNVDTQLWDFAPRKRCHSRCRRRRSWNSFAPGVTQPSPSAFMNNMGTVILSLWNFWHRDWSFFLVIRMRGMIRLPLFFEASWAHGFFRVCSFHRDLTRKSNSSISSCGASNILYQANSAVPLWPDFFPLFPQLDRRFTAKYPI